jgi:aspartate/methionine/tyrosine aminotransferase
LWQVKISWKRAAGRAGGWRTAQRHAWNEAAVLWPRAARGGDDVTRFQPFEMERWMSKFEQAVEYNLSESGVHPMLVSELLDERPGAVEELLATDLNYPHVNGTPELRAHIASLYDGCGADNVLLTPGDGIAVMLPNYMQVWGLAQNHGLDLKTFGLREEAGWGLDLDGLDAAVGTGTKLIAVCNPNNPTGHILNESEMQAIVAAAERVGAWILADEVYAGAERDRDEETPSFYGRYDRVIATGSTSKAYGLPGLRIGWAAGPVETIDQIWARHEYTTLSATKLSNRLAAIALSPEVRPRIIRRTRDYIRRGYPVLEGWMERHPGTFELVPPQAAAIAFVRYHIDVNSTAFVDRLREEKSVLIVPGDHFGLDRFLRISFGLPHDYLTAALDRIGDLVTELGG